LCTQIKSREADESKKEYFFHNYFIAGLNIEEKKRKLFADAENSSFIF